MEKHLLHPTILRAYDIRGIVNETLSYKDAYVIGLAFANILRFRNHGNKVVVGRDGRLTSPRLAKSLCDGLVAGGVKVCDIGCGSTPMLYYANMKLKADGAIQITGSHNPPTHNGFKMLMDNTVFYGNDIKELGEVCSNGINGQPGGSFVEIKIFDEYVSRILNNAVSGDYTVIWDCGNGAAGPATEAVTRQLSGHHKVLFSDIDGTFPIIIRTP